jgi:hypothetical protein
MDKITAASRSIVIGLLNWDRNKISAEEFLFVFSVFGPSLFRRSSGSVPDNPSADDERLLYASAEERLQNLSRQLFLMVTPFLYPLRTK